MSLRDQPSSAGGNNLHAAGARRRVLLLQRPLRGSRWLASRVATFLQCHASVIAMGTLPFPGRLAREEH